MFSQHLESERKWTWTPTLVVAAIAEFESGPVVCANGPVWSGLPSRSNLRGLGPDSASPPHLAQTRSNPLFSGHSQTPPSWLHLEASTRRISCGNTCSVGLVVKWDDC